LSLSILIPVYNYTVTALVIELLKQAETLSVPIEIVLLDDFSDPFYHNQYNAFSHGEKVKVFFNPANSGRELSRKKLSTLAAFDNLLFLDCDVKIIEKLFIEKYLNEIQNGYEVVVGGHIYQAEKPLDIKKILHWKYGTLRECHSSITNSQTFKASNFLIRKDIFLRVPAFNGFKSYGHEDTFWGIWFEEKEINVNRIKNPVLHAGLEDTDVFLNKSLEALVNLKTLSLQKGQSKLVKHIKIFRWYIIFKKIYFLKLIRFFYEIFEKESLKNLHSENPSLVLFDWMRLASFSKL
jgi:glycosyltransferase involved in cell wall biosynthesis